MPNNDNKMTGSASSNAILKFEKHHFKSRSSVVMYAYIEAINIKFQTASPSDKQPYINNIYKQDVFSFGFYIKSDYTNLISSQHITYTGYDAKEKFVKNIIILYDDISKKLNYYSKAN